ncbi:DUF4097 family beta strand repeat-containing protein [Streptomyces sp. NPDC086796]|uniref:DUF4097 family beta strand repeat-containing protein n=1 Tax=Streptomyces sp. NPDC086796 TaxID=3365760 RepID=UPI003821A28A
MTTRKLAAETTGPVTIDASLLGHGGTITVRAEADCERATLTITTADEHGASAEAVKEATLRQIGTRLQVSVQGSGGGSDTMIVTGGGTSVIQSFGTVTGSVTGMTITGNGNFVSGNVGGDVIINGVRVSGGTVVRGGSPIEITAVVPEGSSVEGHTQSAGVETTGALLGVSVTTQSGGVRVLGHASRVDAKTQSGSVAVEQAAQINAKTMSGSIRLGRTDVVTAKTMSGSIGISDFGGTAELKTMSGSISVHATAGGDVRAKTMSGSINVTATEAALADDLDVQANSMSGRVSIPPRRTGDSGPRRRR